MFNSFVDTTYTFMPAEPPKKRPSDSERKGGLRRQRSRTEQTLTRTQIVLNVLMELESNMSKALLQNDTQNQQIFESEPYQRLRSSLTTLKTMQDSDNVGFFTYLKLHVHKAVEDLSVVVDNLAPSDMKTELEKYVRRLLQTSDVSDDFIDFLNEGQEEASKSAGDTVKDVVSETIEAVADVADAIVSIPEVAVAAVVDAIDPPSRREYQINTWYEVRLSKFGENLPRREMSAALNKLKKGPQRWKLLDQGVGTMTFEGKTSDISVNSNHVILNPLLVEKPTTLEHNMLIEVTWRDWPEPGQVHTGVYRYVQLEQSEGIIPSDKHETELQDADFWEFDAEKDEWRFPDYPVLQVDDIVDVQFTYDYRGEVEDAFKARGVERVRIREPFKSDDNSHAFLAEYVSPKRVIRDSDTKDEKNEKAYDNQVIVDVWYRQLAIVEDIPSPESSGIETEDLTEDSDDERTHDTNTDVEYHGKTYSVTDWKKIDDGDFEYELTPKGPHDPEDVLLVPQEELNNSWSPDFAEGELVIYDGRAMLVVGHDYGEKKYVLKEVPNDEPEAKEDDARITVAPEDIVAYEEMPYSVGRMVVFNWELCSIVSVDNIQRAYVLDSGRQYLLVDHKDLEGWCLQTEDQTCWKVEGMIERSRKRGSKKNLKYVLVNYIQLRSATASKEVTEGVFEAEYKDQEDIDAFLKSQTEVADEDDVNGTKIVSFDVGETVEIYEANGKHRYGTIVRYVPGKIVENDAYVILVDGEEEEINVAGFGRVEEDVQLSEESFDDPMDDTDSSSSSESEDDTEEEGDFKVDDHVSYNNVLYKIESVDGRVYTLVNANDERVENVAEDDLIRYEPSFHEGEQVYDANFDEKKIEEVYGDGTCKLVDEDDFVNETDLHVYRDPLIGLVKIIGSDEIFMVVSGFDRGQYVLKNAAIEDDPPRQVSYDEVYAFDGPVFDEDQVVIYDQDQYARINSFDYDTATYVLESVPRRRFRESELMAAPPMMSKGEMVQIVDEEGEQKVLKIKKVNEIERTYTLSDNTVVQESEVEEPPLDDQ